MLLRQLSVKDFRCYSEIVDIPIHRLTVFIGENDAGKTVLLDALNLLLTNKNPSPDDYRCPNPDQVADTIIISGEFDLDEHDTLPEDFRSMDGKTLTLTKIFRRSSMRCEVDGRGFADQRLNTFDKQPAAVQIEILAGLDVTPQSNGEKRSAQFQEALTTGVLTKQATKLEVGFSSLSEHLPRFEYIASTDYKQPDSMVQRALQSVVDGCVHPLNPTTGEPELLPELERVKTDIKEALNYKIDEITEVLRRTDHKIKAVQVNPQINFARSVTATNLTVDVGDGPQLVNSVGEGTKKRLWMGLLDWEQKLQETENLPVIRVYDEPDINLDYKAERKFFSNILQATSKLDSRTQVIICTHAVTMIDRAPAQSINLIKVHENGNRSLEFLSADSDEAVMSFLSIVGRSIGVSNSSIFYERAFLVVEGESEETAIQTIYQNLYGRSLIEDGIVLINLHTCSAWKSVLKILLNNRADLTVMLLDQDCTHPESSGHITTASLEELGYPATFLTTSCFYVGTKEFEDAFATADIVSTLNHFWPKDDGSLWVDDDVDRFRQVGIKFSDELINHVRRNCVRQKRSSLRKPNFADTLAQECSTEAQIPEPIKTALYRLRIKAGCATIPIPATAST